MWQTDQVLPVVQTNRCGVLVSSQFDQLDGVDGTGDAASANIETAAKIASKDAIDAMKSAPRLVAAALDTKAKNEVASTTNKQMSKDAKQGASADVDEQLASRARTLDSSQHKKQGGQSSYFGEMPTVKKAQLTGLVFVGEGVVAACQYDEAVIFWDVESLSEIR